MKLRVRSGHVWVMFKGEYQMNILIVVLGSLASSALPGAQGVDRHRPRRAPERAPTVAREPRLLHKEGLKSLLRVDARRGRRTRRPKSRQRRFFTDCADGGAEVALEGVLVGVVEHFRQADAPWLPERRARLFRMVQDLSGKRSRTELGAAGTRRDA